MYVTSMLIDGFKSYGRRTEVKGFDPLFNAITGLNGSGKSNILDGICFVLGITNLSHVRATNLQELVYKNGQAGVTRAIVSITFDNRDKAHSPLGYEQYDEITITRQVVVGGRNKYAINGVSVQNSRVQDMFRSVKLNVNNPHFLIMQGRITKVLNMKPPEILSMVEEAAGTRLYESKKQLAVKTIEKKDAKLKEISDIVDEEISPTMTRLKEERTVYLEFQKVQREYEHLKKFCVAFKYVSMQERCTKLKEEQTALATALETIHGDISECNRQSQQLDNNIAELQAQRDMETGGMLKKLEVELEDFVKTEAKSAAALKGMRDSIKSEEKKKSSLTKNLADDRAALQRKEDEMAAVKSEFDQLRTADQQHADALRAAQSRYQTISAGVAVDGDTHSATLAQQLMDARRTVSDAQTGVRQTVMKLKQARQQQQQQQKQLNTTSADHSKQQQQLQRTQTEVDQLEKSLSELAYDEARVELLQNQQRDINCQISALRDKIDVVESRFPQLTFDYRDPEPNFDRSAIFGSVGKLFQLRRADTATALEVTAGGKLYNVVVKNEVVGKKLLEKGQLQKRVTFIPLNQIVSRPIDTTTLQHAQKLVGKDNVFTALSCIQYDTQVHKAMEWVFGSTFICKDLDCAKKVAFDGRIQRRAVTLDGDVVDPAGTLTGGSRASRFSVLTELHSVASCHQQLQQLQQQLSDINQQLKQLLTHSKRFSQLNEQLELSRHQLQLINDRLQQSSHFQLQQQLDQLNNNIDEMDKYLAECKTQEADGQQLVQQLEEQLKNQTAVREQQLSAAEKQLKAAEQAAKKSKNAWLSRQEDEQRMKLEIADLCAAVQSTEDQLVSSSSSLEQLAQQLTECQQAADQAKEALVSARAELKRQKEVINAQNREISQLNTKKDALAKTSREKQLEIMQLEHKQNKMAAEYDDSIERVKCIREEHEWIAADERFFGQSGTAYDFQTTDAGEASRRIAKLDEQRAKLSRNVNMRAIKMLGQAEEQYKDLMRKKRIVENDKAKIENVILELDKKKNEALKRAWQQVNKDFGSIFSTLLPGTSAKLQPPEGQTALDGLEVRVAFGGVWKDSLAELSGGQRSLVALSLILALLLFKPAPIYILDEVDAALDLSHTQNIGTMLRTHFKHSQFIVVSLKDGMFNNANVLFKTKFVDGMSTVARFTQHVPPSSSK